MRPGRRGGLESCTGLGWLEKAVVQRRHTRTVEYRTSETDFFSLVQSSTLATFGGLQRDWSQECTRTGTWRHAPTRTGAGVMATAATLPVAGLGHIRTSVARGCLQNYLASLSYLDPRSPDGGSGIMSQHGLNMQEHTYNDRRQPCRCLLIGNCHGHGWLVQRKMKPNLFKPPHVMECDQSQRLKSVQNSGLGDQLAFELSDWVRNAGQHFLRTNLQKLVLFHFPVVQEPLGQGALGFSLMPNNKAV